MNDLDDDIDAAFVENMMRETMGEKPLFIPLRTQWFREFEAGSKDTEFRAYGPRWNERTCRIGRKATISHGYSGKRLARIVTAFAAIPWADAPEVARMIYPDAAYIAAIHLPPRPSYL